MALPSIRGIIRELRADRRELGWKGLFKKHGWRPIIIFFVFYLVRDLILYILIPLAIYWGVKG